jgi:hypothetical protein
VLSTIEKDVVAETKHDRMQKQGIPQTTDIITCKSPVSENMSKVRKEKHFNEYHIKISIK